MQVIIDTSCIVGLVDKSCRKHNEITKIVKNTDTDIIVPSPVMPEVCYMLNKRFGPVVEIKFIDEIISANIQIEILKFLDILRISEILKKYQSLNIGFVDASIVAIAERLKINKLLTLDKKHFSLIIPLGFDYFEVL